MRIIKGVLMLLNKEQQINEEMTKYMIFELNSRNVNERYIDGI